MARFNRRIFKLLVLLIPIVFLISICLYITFTSNITDKYGFKTKKHYNKIGLMDIGQEIENNGKLISALEKETNNNIEYKKKLDVLKDSPIELKNYISQISKASENRGPVKSSEIGKNLPTIHDTEDGWCLNPQIPHQDGTGRPLANHIDMLELYDTLAFDNPDGGVWKQGFDIGYKAGKDWNRDRPLNVFVVPHSHDDPGWIKTILNYYETETKHIFENMVRYLVREPRMRFIYEEISFFSLWWNATSDENRATVKKLVTEGRLEFVTGGWVMNDEANCHYSAMVDQMVEGSQWLDKQLGVKPEIGWFIDPFGHSSTNAYLIKKAGLKGLLIQRVHYSIKKHFSRERALEFTWRQHWDKTGENDVFCHMMPFYSYDIPHTCGPDPKICCQFDFNRLPGSSVSCPWGIQPEIITDPNVESKAKTLLDQYRKKSKLYRTNNVLIPLGDDFRYKTSKEWEWQMENYLKIFDHLNSNPKYNVKIKFATLSEYFKAAMESPTRPQMPVVTGDFFTYADRDDHYWSGYYVSRPQYKRMDRILESKLRSAEIFYSYALARARTRSHEHLITKLTDPDLVSALVSARRNLGLFQHHDGITGTAKTLVVNDYASRMVDAMKKSDHILALSISFLASLDHEMGGANDVAAAPSDTADLELKNSDKSAKRYDPSVVPPPVFDPRYPHGPENLIRLISGTSDSETIHLVNSLAQEREDLVSLYVDTINVCVKDGRGHNIKAQINPLLTQNLKIDSQGSGVEIYEVVFLMKLKALSVTPIVISLEGTTCPETVLAEVSLWNGEDDAILTKLKSKFKIKDYRKRPNTVESTARDEIYSLSNNHQKLTFDSRTGLLKSTDSRRLFIQFAYYKTMERPETSGAYLFIPDGPARNISVVSAQSKVTTLNGPILSKSIADLSFTYGEGSRHGEILRLVHRVTLPQTPLIQNSRAIYVENDIDMQTSANDNKEIVMRIQTDIDNPDGEFYTDLNGFQIQKRRYLKKLPIQANFYPIPAMAFLEDSNERLTLLTAQPLGTSSLYKGSLEVIMDRRLAQDDNRGLFQTVQDNEPMTNRFVLCPESVVHQPPRGSPPPSNIKTMGWFSLTSTQLSLRLLHPPSTIRNLPLRAPVNSVSMSLSTATLPTNIHLVNARTLLSDSTAFGPEQIKISNEIGVTFHTMGVDCRFGKVFFNTTLRDKYLYQVDSFQLFPNLKIKEITETTLSFTREITDSQSSNTSPTSLGLIKLKAMELQAFKIIISQ